MPAWIAGLAVDDLSRFLLGGESEAARREAFAVALLGAELSGRQRLAYDLLQRITPELTDAGIRAACSLVRLEQVYRAGIVPSQAELSAAVGEASVCSIRLMTDRAVAFFIEAGSPSPAATPVWSTRGTGTI